MAKVKEQKTEIDFNEKLVNCLQANEPYVAACKRRDELAEQLKRAEMAFSFGEYEKIKDFAYEAVEAVRKGEPIAPASLMMNSRDIAMRKILLLKKALERQSQIVRRMEPKIWAAALPQYDPLFAQLFDDLIEAAEQFLTRLYRVQRFKQKFLRESGIDEIIWPPRWRIDQSIFNRIGINADGKGLFWTWIAQLKKNWDEPKPFKGQGRS